MSRKLILPLLKDANGIYLPQTPAPPSPVQESFPIVEITTDVSIDSLKLRGLATIDRIMISVWKEASTGMPSRESVQNLKDCLGMLKDLKADEDEALKNLDDKALESKL